MAQVFIRVELRGTPSAAVYESLHSYMASLNWSQTISGTAGVSALPHAMYYGHTDKVLGTVVSALRRGIESKVWAKAVVLIAAASDWAMEPA